MYRLSCNGETLLFESRAEVVKELEWTATLLYMERVLSWIDSGAATPLDIIAININNGKQTERWIRI
jgi:hypothetical protein